MAMVYGKALAKALGEFKLLVAEGKDLWGKVIKGGGLLRTRVVGRTPLCYEAHETCPLFSTSFKLEPRTAAVPTPLHPFS
jgi:hypothetical protein